MNESIVLTIDGPSAHDRASFTWRDVDAAASADALVEHTEKLSPKVRGEGVRLYFLIDPARARRATHAIVHGGGDYRACLSLAECESAVVAHRLDGAPLPAE